MKIIEYREYIEKNIDIFGENELSLKQFLINIVNIIEEYRIGISPNDLLSIIERSLKCSLEIEYDNLENLQAPNLGESENTYNTFKNTILFQIIELQTMENEGVLDQEFIEFGIDSPRGNRWYNFEIDSYLECSSGWLVDRYGEEMEFDSNWNSLILLFEMGRLYE